MGQATGSIATGELYDRARKDIILSEKVKELNKTTSEIESVFPKNHLN